MKMFKSLDTELLLAHVLNKPRSYLYAHPETKLSTQQQQKFTKLLNRRKNGEPMAYILGHKEFYSLDLKINKHVLIPRPETELLVDLILDKFSATSNINLVDFGTGSGAIALAIAKHRPNWQILAIDKSRNALKVAQNNAQNLNIKNIQFIQHDWCRWADRATARVAPTDIIVSNPPYITGSDLHPPFEPKIALAGGKDGLKHIKTIIKQAKNILKPNGLLFLEHGFDQAQQIQTLMKKHGYTKITTHQDLANHDRVTMGCGRAQ
jgi:release factor glutamine methyltransferase